jgi:chromosome segregation ATPase
MPLEEMLLTLAMNDDGGFEETSPPNYQYQSFPSLLATVESLPPPPPPLNLPSTVIDIDDKINAVNKLVHPAATATEEEEEDIDSSDSLVDDFQSSMIHPVNEQIFNSSIHYDEDEYQQKQLQSQSHPRDSIKTSTTQLLTSAVTILTTSAPMLDTRDQELTRLSEQFTSFQSHYEHFQHLQEEQTYRIQSDYHHLQGDINDMIDSMDSLQTNQMTVKRDLSQLKDQTNSFQKEIEIIKETSVEMKRELYKKKHG